MIRISCKHYVYIYIVGAVGGRGGVGRLSLVFDACRMCVLKCICSDNMYAVLTSLLLLS